MKEREKVDKYGDLKIEIAKMWQLRKSSKKVVPVVIRALGSILPNLKKHLDTLEIPYNLDVLHKSELLGSACILRKILFV